MKLTKQQWTMIIVGVVVVFLVYWFFFRKKKAESGYLAKWLTNNKENMETGYGPMGGMYSHFGYETGFNGDTPGSGWGLTESNFRRMGGVGVCPPGQVPCGMSQTGCCPKEVVGGTAKQVVCPPGQIMIGGKCVVSPGPTIPADGLASTGIAGAGKKSTGIAGTGVGAGSAAVKCPDGFTAFQVTTPSGVRWGCRGYVPGKPGMQYTNPI